MPRRASDPRRRGPGDAVPHPGRRGPDEALDGLLEREGRTALAQSCFDFLPYRVQLDLLGWEERDIFAHA